MSKLANIVRTWAAPVAAGTANFNQPGEIYTFASNISTVEILSILCMIQIWDNASGLEEANPFGSWALGDPSQGDNGQTLFSAVSAPPGYVYPGGVYGGAGFSQYYGFEVGQSINIGFELRTNSLHAVAGWLWRISWSIEWQEPRRYKVRGM